jgi:glycosyltransferase involved in cell wall biosynthesis
MPSLSKKNITVVIPVKNEAKNLPRCIEAVRSMGSVVVVDSGSTDETQAVAKAADAEVLAYGVRSSRASVPRLARM